MSRPPAAIAEAASSTERRRASRWRRRCRDLGQAAPAGRPCRAHRVRLVAGRDEHAPGLSPSRSGPTRPRRRAPASARGRPMRTRPRARTRRSPSGGRRRAAPRPPSAGRAAGPPPGRPARGPRPGRRRMRESVAARRSAACSAAYSAMRRRCSASLMARRTRSAKSIRARSASAPDRRLGAHDRRGCPTAGRRPRSGRRAPRGSGRGSRRRPARAAGAWSVDSGIAVGEPSAPRRMTWPSSGAGIPGAAQLATTAPVVSSRSRITDASWQPVRRAASSQMSASIRSGAVPAAIAVATRRSAVCSSTRRSTSRRASAFATAIATSSAKPGGATRRRAAAGRVPAVAASTAPHSRPAVRTGPRRRGAAGRGRTGRRRARRGGHLVRCTRAGVPVAAVEGHRAPASGEAGAGDGAGIAAAPTATASPSSKRQTMPASTPNERGDLLGDDAKHLGRGPRSDARRGPPGGARPSRRAPRERRRPLLRDPPAGSITRSSRRGQEQPVALLRGFPGFRSARIPLPIEAVGLHGLAHPSARTGQRRSASAWRRYQTRSARARRRGSSPGSGCPEEGSVTAPHCCPREGPRVTFPDVAARPSKPCSRRPIRGRGP